ncbi:hypothetical protein RKE25_02565 [Dyella sp. BiH032]|uniref:hypothetical protein n=1 Tax=Dyella sp. BiH032 TaxID=3075430 RepID=UPI00289379F7|nr:hypothetical protein [Dyella sp. BiH032]WNL46539.1 hypothetical protein RKE25_02565 [Dyella sp. BiH032]
MDLKLQVLLQMLDKVSAPLRRVQGSSRAAGEALRKTRDRLRELDRAQQQVAEFRKLKEGSKTTAARMEALQKRISDVASQMRSSLSPSESLRAEFNRLTAEARKLRGEEDAQQAKLQALRGHLAAAGVNTAKLASEEVRLRTATRETNATLEKQTAQLRTQGELANRRRELDARLSRGQALGANMSIAGYGSMAAGRHILGAINPTIEEAKAFQTQVAQLRAQGIGDAAVEDATKFARGMDVMGNSATDNLKMLKEAYTVLRDMHEAEAVTPFLAKMKFGIEAVMAQGGHGEGHGERAELMFADLLKTAELRGAAKTPESLKRVVDFATQAYVASGGMITSEDMLNMIKTGGVAAKQLDDQSFFFGLLHTMQEMGGHRTGTGLATAYQNWAAGRSTQQSAEELAKLGLINKDAVKYGKTGHITKLLPGALKDVELYESNPFRYLMERVIPAINPDGKLNDKQVVSKINSLFSGRKGGDLFASMFLERANIAKHLAAAPKAFGVEALYSEAGRTAQGQQIDLEKRKADLYRELGEQILPTYVGLLARMVNALKAMTAWADRHPALARGLGLVASVIGVLAVAAGGLMITLGGLIGQFSLLRFAIGRAGLGLAARAGGAGAVAAGPGLLGRVAMGARGAVLALGAVSWPLLAIAAAIGAVVFLVWKYWQPIKAFFVGIGQGLSEVLGPALGALGAALSPLKPLWDALVGSLESVWRWFGELFSPMQATKEQLDAASSAGAVFGRALGYVLTGVVEAVTWVVKAFTWLGTTIGEGIGWIVTNASSIGDAIKAPFVAAFEWIGGKIRWLVERWQAMRRALGLGDGPADTSAYIDAAEKMKPQVDALKDRYGQLRAGGMGQGEALKVLATDALRFDNTPVKATSASASTSNVYHITVPAAAGGDAKDTARAIRDELDRRDRDAAKQRRSRFADIDE